MNRESVRLNGSSVQHYWFQKMTILHAGCNDVCVDNVLSKQAPKVRLWYDRMIDNPGSILRATERVSVIRVAQH